MPSPPTTSTSASTSTPPQPPPPEPIASPLPPLSLDDPLTPAQWRTLLAIADAVIPTIEPKTTTITTTTTTSTLFIPPDLYAQALKTLEDQEAENGDSRLAAAYLAERPSGIQAFRDNIWRLMSVHMATNTKAQLLSVLDLLDTRPGALLLTSSPTPFADQPALARQQIILAWSTARLPVFRSLAKSFTTLVKRNWLITSPTVNALIGFPLVPRHGTPVPTPPFTFLDFSAPDAPTTIDTDVVVVGSGCGGSVAAANVAAAGYRVLVVEKAYHWPASHFPMAQLNGIAHLYMDGTNMISDDTNVAVVAGSCFGGGGTVNWSASLQTQGFVRREWAAGGALPFFTSPDFQTCLDRVCARMGVGTDSVRHNATNAVLLEGARKLGWSCKPVPQNSGGKQHYCGYCTLGCASGEKQGPVMTYLKDAAAKGARFAEGFDVREVLWEKRGGVDVAVGVRGVWTSRDRSGGVSGPADERVVKRVVVRARKVIVSAGTMQSPLLLRRSGIRNPNVGRNLRLHPVSLVGAVFPTPTRPWEGGILTAVVSEFENLDGGGHGAKLEATSMLPDFFTGFQPWTGGLQYKLDVPRLRNTVGYISLARDAGSGTVYPDPVDGRCRFKYVPTAADRRHIVEGLVGLAKICLVEGALEIFTVIPGVPAFKRAPKPTPSPDADDEADAPDAGINDVAFCKWLDRVRAAGLNDADMLFLSAHQMGTCKMGRDPRGSVVDAAARVWGTDGCFVADASVFPSGSGVNPMVTNMAISDWTSRGVVRELRMEDEGEGRGVRGRL